MTKTKPKPVTIETYFNNMDAILLKCPAMANALLEMLQYTSSVKVIPRKTKKRKK